MQRAFKGWSTKQKVNLSLLQNSPSPPPLRVWSLIITFWGGNVRASLGHFTIEKGFGFYPHKDYPYLVDSIDHAGANMDIWEPGYKFQL